MVYFQTLFLLLKSNHLGLERDLNVHSTAQKMMFSIKDFFSKCDQSRSFMENLIFCAVQDVQKTHWTSSECLMYVQFTSRGYPFKTILRYFINAFQSKDHTKFLYGEKEVDNFGGHGQRMTAMLGY